MQQAKKQAIALIAILNHKHEILLLKRAPDVHYPDVWSFPGGKIKAGEAPLTAAKRELKEETGLVGKSWQNMGEHQHHYDNVDLSFSFFLCYQEDKALVAAESEYIWCALSDLETKKMPEANQALIQMFKNYAAEHQL